MGAICGASARAQIEQKYDDLAHNLKAVKALATDIAQGLPAIDRYLGRLEEILVDVIAMDDAPELNRLLERASRMHQLLRQMEAGSYQIETKRAVDQAWQRLP